MFQAGVILVSRPLDDLCIFFLDFCLSIQITMRGDSVEQCTSLIFNNLKLRLETHLFKPVSYTVELGVL